MEKKQEIESEEMSEEWERDGGENWGIEEATEQSERHRQTGRRCELKNWGLSKCDAEVLSTEFVVG